MREVERAVSGRAQGDRPGDDDANRVRRTVFKYERTYSAAQYQKFQAAIMKIMDELGPEATPEQAESAMHDIVLGTRPDGSIPGRTKHSEPIYTAVLHVNPEGEAWVDGDDGKVMIDFETIGALVGRTARVLEVPDIAPEHIEAIAFDESGLVPMELRDKKSPPGFVTSVLRRDGFRCLSCGSKNRRKLQAHHLHSLALGGKTEIEYMCTLCTRCHSLVHEKLLRISMRLDEKGRPDGLVFFDKDNNARGSYGSGRGGTRVCALSKDGAMTKEALEQAREEILKDENASTDEPRARRRTEIEVVNAPRRLPRSPATSTSPLLSTSSPMSSPPRNGASSSPASSPTRARRTSASPASSRSTSRPARARVPRRVEPHVGGRRRAATSAPRASRTSSVRRGSSRTSAVWRPSRAGAARLSGTCF